MSQVTTGQVQRSVLKDKTSREKAMEQAVQWIAPVTTSIAAVMVALNGGARLTGYGFIVFAIGSIAWSAYGWMTAQDNLLIQHLRSEEHTSELQSLMRNTYSVFCSKTKKKSRI